MKSAESLVDTIIEIHTRIRHDVSQIVPYIQLKDKPEAKATERWDEVAGKLLGTMLASFVLMRTKPGEDPREQPIFKAMQASFTEDVDGVKSGAAKSQYDKEHVRVMGILDAFSPGGDVAEGAVQALRLLKEKGL